MFIPPVILSMFFFEVTDPVILSNACLIILIQRKLLQPVNILVQWFLIFLLY